MYFPMSGGGGAKPEEIGIKYDEANDVVQLYYNGQWVDWKSGGMVYPVGTTFTFYYTGSVEQFTIPRTGVWKLEAWGAQGGSVGGYAGGKGGYSYGNRHFEQDDVIYVCVGQVGGTIVNANAYTREAYNGGGRGRASGNGQSAGGGGGATQIALDLISDGLLKRYDTTYAEKVLVVGGGGGGAYYDVAGGRSGKGGYGGGVAGETVRTYSTAYGGTQTGGYAFGDGQPTPYSYSGGGGSGLYGGRVAELSPAAGGSGYINQTELINGTYQTTGDVREGDGIAKITYVGV